MFGGYRRIGERRKSNGLFWRQHPAAEAKEVFVAGSFNSWLDDWNAREFRMISDGNSSALPADA
jgi:hypothetical protein